MRAVEVKRLLQEAKNKSIEFCVIQTTDFPGVICNVERTIAANTDWDEILVINEAPMPRVVQVSAIKDIKAVVPFEWVKQ